jgi:hypothetical protein
MAQKTIQLNPEYLSVGGKKKDRHNKTRKERKVRPTAPVNPSKLRKEFLNRIKEHQVKTENGANTKVAEDVKGSGTFNSEFNSSMDYLEKLSKERADKKKEQRSMKRTKKQKHMIPPGGKKPDIFVNTELPKEMDMNTIQPPPVHVGEMPSVNVAVHSGSIAEQPRRHNQTVKHKEPLYSSLKNGSRPTFRELMTKGVPAEVGAPAPIQVGASAPAPAPIQVGASASAPAPIQVGASASAPAPIQVGASAITVRREKLAALRAKHQGPKRPMREKRIKTYKYSLGKKDRNVGVLIKNNVTRRNVKKAHADLKKTSILDIKKYLKQHNLLKSGSDAPPDVLRQLYEQTRLAGEIQNNNSDNLLHNYLTK